MTVAMLAVVVRCDEKRSALARGVATAEPAVGNAVCHGTPTASLGVGGLAAIKWQLFKFGKLRGKKMARFSTLNRLFEA